MPRKPSFPTQPRATNMASADVTPWHAPPPLPNLRPGRLCFRAGGPGPARSLTLSACPVCGWSSCIFCHSKRKQSACNLKGKCPNSDPSPLPKRKAKAAPLLFPEKHKEKKAICKSQPTRSRPIYSQGQSNDAMFLFVVLSGRLFACHSSMMHTCTVLFSEILSLVLNRRWVSGCGGRCRRAHVEGWKKLTQCCFPFT